MVDQILSLLPFLLIIFIFCFLIRPLIKNKTISGKGYVIMIGLGIILVLFGAGLILYGSFYVYIARSLGEPLPVDDPRPPFIIGGVFATIFGVILCVAGILKRKNANLANNEAKNPEIMKKCPFCANDVKQEAIVCQFCNRDLPEQTLL